MGFIHQSYIFGALLAAHHVNADILDHFCGDCISFIVIILMHPEHVTFFMVLLEYVSGWLSCYIKYWTSYRSNWVSKENSSFNTKPILRKFEEMVLDIKRFYGYVLLVNCELILMLWKEPQISFCSPRYLKLFSVLWHCWLGIKKSIWPVKIEWWGAAVWSKVQMICIWSAGATATHHLLPH